MRAILNIISDRAFAAAGWRARAIEIPAKSESQLPEILKSAALNNGNLYDLIAEKDHLKPGFALYVNGFLLPGSSRILKTIKDSIKIHVVDCGW